MNKFSNIVNGTVYLQASLKAFELNERTLKDKYNQSVRSLDWNNNSDLEIWCDIINNSYDDCCFTILSARKFFTDHQVFDDIQVFVFQDINGGR